MVKKVIYVEEALASELKKFAMKGGRLEATVCELALLRFFTRKNGAYYENPFDDGFKDGLDYMERSDLYDKKISDCNR